MTNQTNKILNKKKEINDNKLFDNVKIISEFTKNNIEKSYKIDSARGTEAYFSSRYGWTLRKSIE